MSKKELMKEVCDKFGIKIDDIYSKRRDKNTVSAKKVIYYVLRLYGFSYTYIGIHTMKDHQTVLNGVRTISKDLIEYAKTLYKKYSKIELDWEQENKKKLLQTQREKIVELLNKDYTLVQIQAKTGYEKDFINGQLNYLLANKLYKKVPDYRTGGIRVKFFIKK